MKRMTAGWLAAAMTLATTCALATPPAVSATATAASISALQTRLTAINQYQHDLVSVLALRTDAQHLLGAALLARPLHEERNFLGFHALITRAAKADNAGAAVSWIMLSDCKPDHCPNTHALEALSKNDADNAAVWLWRMDLAIRAGKQDVARADLLKAAAAGHYDDYAGSTLQALVAAATSLPVPEATLKAYAGTSNAGPASVQSFLAFSLANTQPRPSLIPASRWCDPAHAPSAAGDIRAACTKLAHVLVWGSSPQAREAGLHLRAVLSSDPETQQAAKDGARDLAWQLSNYSTLALKALDNQAVAVEMLKLGRNGGTEMSLVTALLRQNDIPLQRPDAGTQGMPPATPPSAASTQPDPATTSSAAPAAASSVAPALDTSTG